MDKRTHKRISCGRISIDDRLNLHGSGRLEAQKKTREFIVSCCRRGLKTVLVITGKGRRDWETEKDYGILRESFPDWMASESLKPHVLDYAEAGREHGGEGAWYVCLRRSRSRP